MDVNLERASTNQTTNMRDITESDLENLRKAMKEVYAKLPSPHCTGSKGEDPKCPSEVGACSMRISPMPPPDSRRYGTFAL